MRSNALQQITLPALNGGLNAHDPEYDIADNQSPDMLNLWYKDMALCKRPGQTPLSRRGNVYRVSGLYNGARAVHAGTKLYRWDTQGMKRYAGEFYPAAGYPAGAARGDYAIAAAAGMRGGIAYEKGDTAVYDGVQAVSVTVEGTVSAAGNAAVTVKGKMICGSPLTIRAAVNENDTAEVAAGKFRAALALEDAVTTWYTVGGTGAAVSLTRKEAGTQDETLMISVSSGTSAGLAASVSADISVWHPAMTEIGTGIQDSAGAFCEFGDMMYYLDGAQIWEISDEYNVSAVMPYVPKVMINATPSLDSSDSGEAYNLTGAGFTVWYNGTGGSAVNYYVLAATANTFTIKATLSGTAAVDITSPGTAGWKVRKPGSAWIPGTPVADVSTNTITLASHGLLAGNAVQFDCGTGVLPGGISACNLIYHLPQAGLDGTEVLASVDAMDLKEGTHFTVDRGAGTVDFSGGAAPYGVPAKGTNNVWITAYKTAYEEDKITPKKRRIMGCTSAVRFGGETAGVTGGTRVFVTANPAYPYRYWRSDLGLHVSAGMRYFPDTAEEVLDQNSEAITAAAKMGDELIIFKENSIFAVGYSFDGEEVYYPVRECHSTIGCDMPGSVQLIDNRLVFAHSKSGVHILVSTDNDLENIVKPISANVGPLLLKESGLKEACSCDYGRYYWLCVNGKAYLWDYDTTPYYNYADYDKAQKRLAWYRFDNIGARDFFEDGALCYGGDGGIVRFTASRNDFGKAINAYFKSKAFDLGNPEDEKTFVSLYPGFSMDGNILATVSVGNERTDTYKEETFDIRSFDWSDFTWNAFTWNRIKFAKTYAMRLNMRRAAFLQVKVWGGEMDRGVGLSGLRATYYVNRKMKG